MYKVLPNMPKTILYKTMNKAVLLETDIFVEERMFKCINVNILCVWTYNSLYVM